RRDGDGAQARLPGLSDAQIRHGVCPARHAGLRTEGPQPDETRAPAQGSRTGLSPGRGPGATGGAGPGLDVSHGQRPRPMVRRRAPAEGAGAVTTRSITPQAHQARGKGALSDEAAASTNRRPSLARRRKSSSWGRVRRGFGTRYRPAASLFLLHPFEDEQELLASQVLSK